MYICGTFTSFRFSFDTRFMNAESSFKLDSSAMLFLTFRTCYSILRYITTIYIKYNKKVLL